MLFLTTIIFKQINYLKSFQKSYSLFLNYPSIIYNNEHLAIQETLKKIIDRDINPNVDQWEEANIFPAKKIFKILGDAGIFGIDKPIEYGGSGLDYTYNIAVAEQVGAIRCGGVGMGIGVQLSLTTPSLIRFGSDKLKKEFLAPTISGDLVSCLGVSEIGGGSDVSAIKTTARFDGDDMVINGGKMWITNGLQADWMCLLANTEVDKKVHSNKSLIALPMNLPGIKVTKIDKIGMKSSDTAQIYFDDVRVPKSHIIGERGKGFIYQMMQFQEERLSISASSLLQLERVIKETLEYASQRKMYGKRLIDNQSGVMDMMPRHVGDIRKRVVEDSDESGGDVEIIVVAFTLAELLTELECVRSLLHRAVYNYTFDKIDVTPLASMFHGGTGFTSDVLVSRMFRDLRLVSIGGGADEVMLDIITKYMSKRLD